MAKIIAIPTINTIQTAIIGTSTNTDEAKKMLAVAQTCQSAGFPVPESILKYFNYKIPEVIAEDKPLACSFVLGSDKYVNGIKYYEYDFKLPSGEKLRAKISHSTTVQNTPNE